MKNTNIDSKNLEISYNLYLNLLEEDDAYIVHFESPLLAKTKDDKLNLIEKFCFTEEFGEYYLCNIINNNNESVSIESIKFIGIRFRDILEKCSELLKNNLKSYISFNNKLYKINNILDFISLEIPNGVLVKDIKYNFDFENEELLINTFRLLENQSLEFAQNYVKSKTIIGKNLFNISREYVKYKLSLDDDLVDYFNCETYFTNTANYSCIYDSIVCILDNI